MHRYQNSPSWSNVRPIEAFSLDGTDVHSIDLQNIISWHHRTIIIKELTSNPRPTTRECNALSYTWSLLVTWQRWQSHHLICQSQKPHATHKLHGSRFYGTGVIANWSFTLWEYGFSTCFAPVTLTLTQWPSYMNLTCILSRYTGCAETNFLRQGFWKLSYYRHRDRLTDATKIIHHTASCVVNNKYYFTVRTRSHIFHCIYLFRSYSVSVK